MPDDKSPTEKFGRFDSNRRNVLKKGGLMVTTLTVGVPAASGNAAADNPTTRMNVDVPPVVSSNEKGQVVTTIYPGADIDPEELEDEVDNPDQLGFKLGPNDVKRFEVGEVKDHADSVGSKLVYNGRHESYVMGVFFDSSTAVDWFTPDDVQAKLSAVKKDGDGNPIDMIAWGDDEVIVR